MPPVHRQRRAGTAGAKDDQAIAQGADLVVRFEGAAGWNDAAVPTRTVRFARARAARPRS
jgi:hypothetical protein